MQLRNNRELQCIGHEPLADKHGKVIPRGWGAPMSCPDEDPPPTSYKLVTEPGKSCGDYRDENGEKLVTILTKRECEVAAKQLGLPRTVSDDSLKTWHRKRGE